MNPFAPLCAIAWVLMSLLIGIGSTIFLGLGLSIPGIVAVIAGALAGLAFLLFPLFMVLWENEQIKKERKLYPERFRPFPNTAVYRSTCTSADCGTEASGSAYARSEY